MGVALKIQKIDSASKESKYCLRPNVQKSNLIDSKMNITLDVNRFKTVQGIFKIVEFVLVLIVLLIVRYDRNFRSPTGDYGDGDFLAKGVLVGYAIILPSVLLNYITGGGYSIKLETILNFVGGVLFVAVGSLGLSNEGCAIGFLNLGIGIIFLVEVGQVLKRSSLPQ